jgi:hypothetical protein
MMMVMMIMMMMMMMMMVMVVMVIFTYLLQEISRKFQLQGCEEDRNRFLFLLL